MLRQDLVELANFNWIGRRLASPCKFSPMLRREVAVHGMLLRLVTVRVLVKVAMLGPEQVVKPHSRQRW